MSNWYQKVALVLRRRVLMLVLLGLLVFVVPRFSIAAYPEEGQTTVIFDMSHEQPLSIEKQNFTQAIDFFQEHTEYFIKIHMEGEINSTILNRAHILVIPNPGRDFSTEELEAISIFVSEGGALFLLGDYQIAGRRVGYPQVLNQLLGAISENRIQFTTVLDGADVQGDAITDSVHNLSSPYNIRFDEAGVSSETQAAIFSGVERVVIAAGSLTTNCSDLIVSRGANTSLAVSIDGQIIQEQPPWLAAFETSTARMVLCSSTTMFSDAFCAGLNASWFEVENNALLWYNIFQWLSQPRIFDPTPIMVIFVAIVLLLGTCLFLYSLWRVKRGR